MMLKKEMVLLLALGVMGSAFADGGADRAYWIGRMLKIAAPVVENLAAGTLNEKMPHRSEAATDFASRLEAVGRTFCGILPWFELPDDESDEGRLRARWRPLVLKGLANAVTPGGPDELVFSDCRMQPLVDAAFLAQGLLRAPKTWAALGADVQTNMIAHMKLSRSITPSRDNWVLFASIVEALILEKTGACDEGRLMGGVNDFLKPDGWYVGDGFYSDGDVFALDYYNSYVIQPMMWDVLCALERAGRTDAVGLKAKMKPRFRRQADIQERLISPEGTFPLLGRSICYRFGAFHHLAMSVTLGDDFHTASCGAIRSALTAVIRRQGGDANFDADGWLTVGFNGTQPSLAECYISRGSPYLACFVFVPLGLPPDHPFWTSPGADWTQKAAWGGQSTRIDSALLER